MEKRYDGLPMQTSWKRDTRPPQAEGGGLSYHAVVPALARPAEKAPKSPRQCKSSSSSSSLNHFDQARGYRDFLLNLLKKCRMKELELSTQTVSRSKSALNALADKKIQVISTFLLQRTAEVLRHWDDQKQKRVCEEGPNKSVNEPESSGNQKFPEETLEEPGHGRVGGNTSPAANQNDTPGEALLRKISTHMKKMQIRAHDMFREIDKDGTGSLDEVEFRNALERLGIRLSQEDWTLILKMADINHDGVLSYREFEATMRNFRRKELLEQNTGKTDRSSGSTNSKGTKHLLQKNQESIQEAKQQLRDTENRPIVGTNTANTFVQREIEKRWSKRSERKLNADLVQIQRQKRLMEEEVRLMYNCIHI
jgi:hypothetical protein